MSRHRLPVLAITCVMFFSIFSCGCKSKKTKKTTDETRRATALLDDFCAYLKSGKFDKMDKLIDGSSKEINTLKAYTSSDAKDILETARKRMSYEVSDVKVSGESGEARLSFHYFDVEAVSGKISDDSTSRDIKNLISEASEKELEFTCALSNKDAWYIDAQSADEVAGTLFSFMKHTRIKPEDPSPTKGPGPGTSTTTTVPASYPLIEMWGEWYDRDYNNAYGYHESDTFVRYMVSFIGSFYDEEVTYEFTDAAGNTYKDTAVMDDGDNYVYCEYEPKAKLPVGTLTCIVYDAEQNCVSTGSIEIFPDGQTIPRPMYVFDFHMIDQNGDHVPGYEKNTNYIAAFISLDHLEPDTVLTYQINRLENSGREVRVFDGSVKPDGLTAVLPWEGVSNVEPGEYGIVVSAGDQVLYAYSFTVLADGQKFTVDSPEAELFRDAWCEEANTYEVIDSISKKAHYVYYHFVTIEYYTYMEFSYEVLDGSGNKYKEGKAVLTNSDTVEINIPLDSDYKGKLTIKVYNPSGNLLCESSIEQEK
ncbi:MAG: hypothetical protein J6Y58_03785 [Clostridiales bacterium]|nr:hypothetical protein [Clostridiales bacterium]